MFCPLSNCTLCWYRLVYHKLPYEKTSFLKEEFAFCTYKAPSLGFALKIIIPLKRSYMKYMLIDEVVLFILYQIIEIKLLHYKKD